MNRSREIQVRIGQDKYRIVSDDGYLDYIRNGFEPDMVRLFESLAAGSGTILDIGANIGCTALLFSSLGKQVYAFEPSPTTFVFLEKNIAASGKQNITACNLGLGDIDGEASLALAPSNRSGAFVMPQGKPGSGFLEEKITLSTLDRMVRTMDLKDIDLIKIDVEGYEGHVLRGSAGTLKEHTPLVVLELNHWCLNAFQRTSIPDFFDFLRSLFPILLAVDGVNYLDLHDQDDSYIVMYQHIINMKFPNIVAAFDRSRLETFSAIYRRGFDLKKTGS